MNPTRWIALHCGDEAAALLANHPNAFLLLAQIAMRARFVDCPITGLKVGQAFIGDWKNAGLTQKEYRNAKITLTNLKIGAFKGANKGTVATLIDSSIFSIREETGASKKANQGRTRGEQGATNHKEHKDTKAQKRATLDEIKAFCIEIGLLATDGESTFYKWQGNGWTNKGKPVGNWQATIKSWKAAGYMPSQKTQVSNKPQPISANGFKLS